MPIKIVNTSNHPNFKSFNDWLSEKLAAAQAANNSAEVEKIQTAVSLKEAAANSVNFQTYDVSKDNGVTTEVTVQSELSSTVPEFDFYYQQWVAEFNVQLSAEEIA